MEKSKIRKGLEKLLVAGAVTLGSFGIPSESKADDLNDLLYAMGTILESGVIPIKDRESADFLRRLGHASQHIASWNAINIRNETKGIRIYPAEDTPLFGKGASYFMYNTWKDLDGDGYMAKVSNPQFKKELIGLNKKYFYDDESLYLRLETKNLRGHTATILLLDPRKQKVFSDTLNINEFSWYNYYNLGGRNWRKNVLSKHGYGNYYAAIYIDDQLLGVRGFEWKPTSMFYMGNYFRDFNQDGNFDRSEVIGMGKKRFAQNEQITFHLETYNKKGKTAEIRLFTPSDEELTINSRNIPNDSFLIYASRMAKNLVEKYGSGTYHSTFYVDKDYKGKLDFVIE